MNVIRLLEDLENNYLPIVKQYRFSKSIHQAIPVFKEEKKNFRPHLFFWRVFTVSSSEILLLLRGIWLKIFKETYFPFSRPKTTDRNSCVEKRRRRIAQRSIWSQ